MNDVIQAIMTRRSIRSFDEKLLTKDQLEVLIQAGLCAPSGMCKQSWKFVGILNQEMISKLASVIEDVLGREGYNFYGAKALIITTNLSDSRFAKEDNACALENIFLAAHSMGIGSVWINQLLGQGDDPRVRAILDELDVPKNHEVFGIAALGYDPNEPKGQVSKTGEYVIYV